jgi:polygalacturonase
MKQIPLISSLLISLALSARAAEKNPFTPPHFPEPKFPERSFNVKDFGATGDGKSNDTPAINQAIEKCNAEGGGTVLFPPGKYAAGSIHIKSNIRLLLSPDAMILGGAKEFFEPAEPNQFEHYQDYGHSHFHDSLMWGENIENFEIEGGHVSGGTIGHGDPKTGGGDKLITVVVGKNLLFKNVTHDKGGHFVYLLNDCENITLDHVVIKESRDAVDFMGCRNVQVHDCNFTGCADDTIGVKSDYALGRRINSANFYVWDSYFESGCNGLQFGSETAGDFQNCNFWNIRIGRAMKAGIGITSGDSAVIDGVNYSNIVVKGAACPIYLLIWDRMRTGEKGAKVGTIKNVHLQDITITDCVAGRQGPVHAAAISGFKTSPFENIVLENVKIHYPGDVTNAAAADVFPDYPKDYSPRSLGMRPAAGLYIRHVKGLTLKNVEITFDKPDARPSLAVFDADGLTLDHVTTTKSAGGELARMQKTRNLTVKDSPGFKERKAETVESAKE